MSNNFSMGPKTDITWEEIMKAVEMMPERPKELDRFTAFVGSEGRARDMGVLGCFDIRVHPLVPDDEIWVLDNELAMKYVGFRR